MTYLFSLLFGFVDFKFSGGFYENFLNECYENGINIKNIALCDGGFTARCNIKTYRSLHRTALHHGGRVKIISKKGLPFLLAPLKNRSGFLAGAVIFIFIISFFEGFIWNVEIVGADAVSETLLLSFAESGNLKRGAMWSSVDRDALAWDIMSEFDDVAWAHINKSGAKAIVEINETTPSPEVTDDSALRGENVFRKELTATACRRQNKITVTSRKSYKKLIFFNLQIPLYISVKPGDIEELDTQMMTVAGTELPIGIETRTEKYLTCTAYDLSDAELEALAKKKLSYLEEKELDGYTIINSSPKYETTADGCTVTCAYVVRKK